MDIGQRILKAVQESESTGTIVDNYQGLTITMEPGFIEKKIYFYYKGKTIGFKCISDWPDIMYILATDMCLRNLGFYKRTNSKILGEIA